MDQQEQPRWRPTRRQLMWAGATAGLLTIAILIGYRYDITLWDWIKLLVVPAAIAIAGLWFNRQQQERQREAENERARDGVLQAYLERIGQLLLDKDKPLSKAVKGDAVSTLARSLTLTALSQLDGSRKGTLIQFLSETGLIQGNPNIVREGSGSRRERSRSIIELTSADLSGMVLTSDADLSYVMLGEASLRGAYLRGADLSNAVLFDTDLTDADLIGADLSDAKGTTPEQLKQAKSLAGATMPDGEVYSEDWPKWLKDKENHNEPPR
jgi:Pentapeptide repeats (8 copies)